MSFDDACEIPHLPLLSWLFFGERNEARTRQKIKVKSNTAHLSSDLEQTTKSGGGPSVPCRSTEGETSELAKALAQDTESMRDHHRVHAKKAERLRTRGASRARAAASIATN